MDWERVDRILKTIELATAVAIVIGFLIILFKALT